MTDAPAAAIFLILLKAAGDAHAWFRDGEYALAEFEMVQAATVRTRILKLNSQ